MVTVLKKLSFKQAFVFVMAVSMLCALMLTWIISSILTDIQYDKNSVSNLPTVFEGEYIIGQNAVMQENQKKHEVITFINTWLPLILFFFSTVLASYIFYRWKMKTPLSLLNASIQKINNKELDFSIEYDAQDEIGELIRAFESMRMELYFSFTSQWRAQEDSKILNAAFAHDVRTPLTVLKGQVDVLLRNVKKDKVDQQTLIETLNLLVRHINRIENYTDEMGMVQRLEEICICKKDVIWSSFWPMSQKNLLEQAKTGGKVIHFNCEISSIIISADEAVLIRILENVVSNAIKYAATSVIINIEKSDRNLIIKVCDDGPGFSNNALQHAFEPFYHENSPNNPNTSKGLGLGLYISKTLIERHEGSIMISNGSLNGGCVILTFANIFFE